MRRFALAIAMLFIALAASAQRIRVQPTLEIMEVQDDNLNFSIDDPLRDRIERMTPSLALHLDSARATFLGSYGFDAERYSTHSAFDNHRARDRASIAFAYAATSKLSISLDASQVNTNTIADLNNETGLLGPRARARRTGFGPTAKWRLSPLTTLIASAGVTNTAAGATGSIRAQTQSLAMERRISVRDALTFTYAHDRLRFFGDTMTLINSHVLLATWSHDLRRRDHLTIRVGPRITNGRASADISTSFAHEWKSASAALSLFRTETTVIGIAGPVASEGVQLKLSYSPNRNVQAYAEPAWIRSTHENLAGRVFRLGAGVRYFFTPSIAANLMLSHDLQNGAIDALRADASFRHTTISLGLITRLGTN